MTNYINADKLKVELNEAAEEYAPDFSDSITSKAAVDAIRDAFKAGAEWHARQEQPEPYFYCKYGGTMPLCSDCKRNHNNSSFKTKEITTWYAPSNGTKHCADYIQKEQPEIDLEKEVEKFCLEYDSRKEVWFDMTPRDKKMLSIPTWSNFAANIARHFYELGKKGCNI